MTLPPPSRPSGSPTFTTSRGVIRKSFKVGLYGPEGVGKSSLASFCPGVRFADLELSTRDMDVERVGGIRVEGDDATSWTRLRQWVQSLTSGVHCIDSMTRAEDWCAAYVIKNKKTSEGGTASDSIEDFKYKSGLVFVLDEFRRLLGDIDTAMVRGASFIMTAHNRVKLIKNPDGSDFIRHEPRLMDDPKGSNMLQWVQFLDHCLFIDLDKNVAKGKVTGGGTRTIFTDTAPNRISKTRSLPKDPMPFEVEEEFLDGGIRRVSSPSLTLWKLLSVK